MNEISLWCLDEEQTSTACECRQLMRFEARVGSYLFLVPGACPLRRVQIEDGIESRSVQFVDDDGDPMEPPLDYALALLDVETPDVETPDVETPDVETPDWIETWNRMDVAEASGVFGQASTNSDEAVGLAALRELSRFGQPISSDVLVSMIAAKYPSLRPSVRRMERVIRMHKEIVAVDKSVWAISSDVDVSPWVADLGEGGPNQPSNNERWAKSTEVSRPYARLLTFLRSRPLISEQETTMLAQRNEIGVLAAWVGEQEGRSRKAETIAYTTFREIHQQSCRCLEVDLECLIGIEAVHRLARAVPGAPAVRLVDRVSNWSGALMTSVWLNARAEQIPLTVQSIAFGLKARTDLVERNLLLVNWRARRYTKYDLILDLISVGTFGLYDAVARWDWRVGVKFSTYAIAWIDQKITRYQADFGRTIRLPVHLVEMINKAQRMTVQLERELEREPSDDEIGQALDISAEKVRDIRKISLHPVSLETPIGEQGDCRLGDFIEDRNVPIPQDVATLHLLKGQVEEALEALSQRERRVLQLRFGLTDGRPRTLEEIGGELNLTRERIRQIERKALGRLRGGPHVRELRDFLE